MLHSTCTLITIGDELLIGQVIDTNSAWMAQALNKIGLSVKRRISVGDVWMDIWKALDDACFESEYVLITGGLGPTSDDITKPLLCQYFGGTMVVNAAAKQNVVNIFERINSSIPGSPRPMLERNLMQAEVPDICTVIQNTAGTAPGMMFKKDNSTVISMPGVPHEMKTMMELFVIPHIQASGQLPFMEHRTLLTAGKGESAIAEDLIDFEAHLPEGCKLAYLPNYGMVRLRLSATAATLSEAQEAVNHPFEALKLLVQPILVIDSDIAMQQLILNMLNANGKTLSLAESCTGGYMAHLITQIVGSSSVFNGSAVVYHNTAKQQLLGVKASDLENYGAVSEQVVHQMVVGALAQFKTDYAVAVSGIMGPGGGTAEKPVGTVWVAVGNATQVNAKVFHFRFGRMRNIELTANNAFNMLRLFMLQNL